MESHWNVTWAVHEPRVGLVLFGSIAFELKPFPLNVRTISITIYQQRDQWGISLG